MLLPCPFCGDDPDAVVGRNGFVYFVFCSNCGTGGPSVDNEADAFTLWNERNGVSMLDRPEYDMSVAMPTDRDFEAFVPYQDIPSASPPYSKRQGWVRAKVYTGCYVGDLDMGAPLYMPQRWRELES